MFCRFQGLRICARIRELQCGEKSVCPPVSRHSTAKNSPSAARGPHADAHTRATRSSHRAHTRATRVRGAGTRCSRRGRGGGGGVLHRLVRAVCGGARVSSEEETVRVGAVRCAAIPTCGAFFSPHARLRERYVAIRCRGRRRRKAAPRTPLAGTRGLSVTSGHPTRSPYSARGFWIPRTSPSTPTARTAEGAVLGVAARAEVQRLGLRGLDDERHEARAVRRVVGLRRRRAPSRCG